MKVWETKNVLLTRDIQEGEAAMPGNRFGTLLRLMYFVPFTVTNS